MNERLARRFHYTLETTCTPRIHFLVEEKEEEEEEEEEEEKEEEESVPLSLVLSLLPLYTETFR